MERLDTINIGEILKNSRENLSMTQEEVSKKLNIGRDAVMRIERGTRKITLDEIRDFIRLYNLNIEDLLFTPKEDVNMKGIILAGGSGTRLYPITGGASKQLLQVSDKPMIYYPLSVLIQAKIKDILIITTKEYNELFKNLLGDGKRFGVNISYVIQEKPNGLAEAFILGEEFIGDSPCAMVLGDNIFYGSGIRKELTMAKENAVNGYSTIFGYEVKDPKRFGIMELDKNNNVISIEEKPEKPKSDYAITGLYFFPNDVVKKAKKVKPSIRGELEITSLNDMYLKEKRLKARLLDEGYSWFDTGTFDSLLDASNMVRTIENNRDALICSPEVCALQSNFITKKDISKSLEGLKDNNYTSHLRKIVK